MYEVLGIAPTASDEEVHAAYRRVVKRAHPDAGGSQRAFLRVNAAYRVLSDPGMRRAHDLWLAHLLDGYDQPGRSGGIRPSDGRGAPDGRHAADGRHPATGRPGSNGRPAPGASGSGTSGSAADSPAAGGPSTGGWTPAADGTGPGTRSPAGDRAGSGAGAGVSNDYASGRDFPGEADESGRRRFPGGRRRSRRRSEPTDAFGWTGDPAQTGPPGQPDHAGYPDHPGWTAGGGLGQPDSWSAWSDDDALPSWGADRPARRRYLISMTLCLALFVLSGAVIRLYSVPVALGMMAVAMFIPPLAVFAVNASRRR
ncbi:molecular chaperone DnaJ [Parafrankia colletiae]|uniref:Molecular chaperone DnaJ n=2 Tax=Parafrankia colletiae TaxID=573497 RepID=A0A1S1RMG1_9ACTN|nr:molecular chaperone DnaJ [Parafrankia colletiae]